MQELKVFAGTAGGRLAAEVCKNLDLTPGKALVERFADGEVRIEVAENVRGKDCFIINPLCPPAENLLEMILLARALGASSAGRITLIITYLGYNRQDKKHKPRVPFSAHIVISTVAQQSGAQRVLLLDAHSEATLGVFDDHGIKVDHLYASVVSLEYLKPLLTDNFLVAAPDAGGVKRARAYARRLGCNVVVFDKGSRAAPGSLNEDQITIIGDVRERNLLFIDDMIDTAGTVIGDAKAARKAGAKRIIVFATHPLLSEGAIRKLEHSEVEEIIVTDSITRSPEELKTHRLKVTVLSIAPLLAQAVRKIHAEESLSALIL